MLRRPLGATGIPAALFFFLLTFLINFTVLAFGVRRGIERLNRFATPILFVLGILLMLRVLTLPGISDGLGAMWNPDFSALTSPQVWLEASGQVFFTLSIAMGIILCYASYVRPGQDIILPSVTAIATNTFAEIILGGTIVVPLAVVLYGANVSEVARMGTFGLAFQTMPIVFGKLPLPDLLICLWFFMLFLAGITSCISIQQPLIAFCEDDLSWSRRRSILLVGLFSFLGSLVAVFGLAGGAVDELDFWGASFLLVVSGTLQAFLFAFVLGEEGWELLNEGAKRRLPRWIWWVMRWVTPFYLLVMLVAWTIHDGWRTIILQDIDSAASVTLLGYSVNHLAFLWGVRGFLLLILVLALLIIRHAWRKRGDRP
jgi:SNF family Na+-dependent transporter